MNNISYLLLLLFFSLLMIGIGFSSRQKQTDNAVDEFLLANRKVGVLPGAFSVAISWVWAPAIFIAALQSYEKGLAGAFWFIIPNILCFFLFAFVAVKLRKEFPNGCTVPQFIKQKFQDKKTHIAFLGIFFSYQFTAIIINAVAGGSLLYLLTGIPFWISILGISGTALIYSVLGGFRASIRTDIIQMGIVLILAGILVPWTISNAGGFAEVVGGIAGRTGEFANIFNPQVAWYFGIPMTISLLAGPIGDQQFFQRAFAVKAKNIKKTFFLGGLIFGSIPIVLSLLGFLAANSGLEVIVENPQMVAPTVMNHFLPTSALLLFTFMAFAGLASTIDSAFSAVSSFLITDIFNPKVTAPKKIFYARIGMIVFGILGTSIALFEPKLLWIFFIQGAAIAAGFFPVIFSIFLSKKYFSKNAAFWSVMLGFFIAVPISIYANFSENQDLIVIASILSICIAPVVAFIFWIFHKTIEIDLKKSRLTP